MKTADGILPDFLIIGAARCGTTSLHHYLNLHPEISMTAVKELRFFLSEYNWSKGIDWYKAQFGGEARLYGEATPYYTCYPVFANVPARIHQVVPHVKLIYILRDPLARTLSDYSLHLALGREKRSFEDAVADSNSRYIVGSLYYTQIEQYLAYFPLSAFLILTLEELRSQPRKTMRTIFQFLGVEENFYSPDFTVVLNRTQDHRPKNRVGLWLKSLNNLGVVKRIPFRWRVRLGQFVYLPFSTPIERPFISVQTRQRLEAMFREDTNRLRALTGKRFAEWTV